jgi:hypothetical protein
MCGFPAEKSTKEWVAAECLEAWSIVHRGFLAAGTAAFVAIHAQKTVADLHGIEATAHFAGMFSLRHGRVIAFTAMSVVDRESICWLLSVHGL